MTVTRKREGGVEPNLGKKKVEPNKKKPSTGLGLRGFHVNLGQGMVPWVIVEFRSLNLILSRPK